MAALSRLQRVEDKPRAPEVDGGDEGRGNLRNIGAVYVWLLIILAFTVWVPGTFATRTTNSRIGYAIRRP